MPNLTINDILIDAYQEAGASPEYKTGNILGLKHLHIVTQDLWTDFVHAKKANKNWDIWYTETMSLQDEYTKPSVTSTTVGAEYIETLNIAYSDDTYQETGKLVYTPCRYAMDHEIANWNKYLESQSKLDPIYYERDKSYFIAPDPRTSDIGVDRIKITGIKSIASGSWTIATTEEQTGLSITELDCLKLGLIWKINAWHRRDQGVIISSKNEWINAKNEVLNKTQTDSPWINNYPN